MATPAEPDARTQLAATPLDPADLAAGALPSGLSLAVPEPAPAWLAWAELAAPTGRVYAVAGPAGLAGLAFADAQRAPLAAWQRRFPKAAIHRQPNAFAATAARLAGEPAALTLAPWGTAFQRAVWTALLAVSAGAVVTYAGLAAAAGRPGAARAVGGALAANPLPLAIPCHRVVAAGARLGPYSGGGPARKAALLAREGVVPA